MLRILRSATIFTLTASVLLLAIDGALSLGYQAPPTEAKHASYAQTHGLMHLAVVLLGFVGSSIGFALQRTATPSAKSLGFLALAYALCTAFVGPGSFMLAGLVGAAAWLLLGPVAFALGTGLFSKPWRRPPVE